MHTPRFAIWLDGAVQYANAVPESAKAVFGGFEAVLNPAFPSNSGEFA
jgi:hypothetical protein